jgi:3alpha(or 20beta)-hydroxysteroid dehydrogenase
MFSLEGKVAIITGGASGMGLATVKRFRAAGANVIMADIADGMALAKEVGAEYVKTNVTKEEDIENLYKKAIELYGKVDIVVNNVGAVNPDEFLEEMNIDTYKRLFDINYYSVLFSLKYASKYMSEGGSIINTQSLGGVIAFPGYGPYASTKAAVGALTRQAAIELAPKKIRVNAVCPSTIDTPMAHQPGNEAELMLAPYVWPLGRMGKPEEVAAFYHFLAADDVMYLTGTEINLDGGYRAGIGLNLITKLLGEEEEA